MPVARHSKRQAPPDFYQGTAAWYFTLDTAEWFGLADKRDQDEKERKRKAREQKEQERIEQKRREQEKEHKVKSREATRFWMVSSSLRTP